MLRYNWNLQEVKDIYSQAFPDLIFAAQVAHRANFKASEIQRSTLLSIKTGGCSEDCSYCPQSVHNDTGLERHRLLPQGIVLKKAAEAKEQGSTRFCMGAAWRQIKDGEDFDRILEMVRGVSAMGMEVCCTLGMLTPEQAVKLKEAGCHAYNHNLDTSPEYYGEIITTRTYQDRLDTLKNVRNSGITVCCGGIVGLGESRDDRLSLLVQLANQSPHPESVPINMLVKVEGTPLQDNTEVDPIDFVRMVATAKILMPASMIRLSAGRNEMSDEMQALCFVAGANSIFAGEKLLTTANPGEDKDNRLMERLGMSFYASTGSCDTKDAACGTKVSCEEKTANAASSETCCSV